jgi:hypothetical protein
MPERRYDVVCQEGCEIEADTTDDGLFSKAQAHRRAGHHEGALDHSCEVEVAEETLQWRCPVCQKLCNGERERDRHAGKEPGVKPSSFVRV